jgi:hypothetical protein
MSTNALMTYIIDLFSLSSGSACHEANAPTDDKHNFYSLLFSLLERLKEYSKAERTWEVSLLLTTIQDRIILIPECLASLTSLGSLLEQGCQGPSRGLTSKPSPSVKGWDHPLPFLCSDWRSALTATGTLRKNVIYSGILIAKFFDCGVSLTEALLF